MSMEYGPGRKEQRSTSTAAERGKMGLQHSASAAGLWGYRHCLLTAAVTALMVMMARLNSAGFLREFRQAQMITAC